MQNHYFKTKVVKMGQWATTLLDMETWYGQETNHYFKKLFGIPKGILIIYDGTTEYSQGYVPEDYFIKLHKQIKKIRSKNYRELEKKLKTFYPLNEEAKRKVSKIYNDPAKLTNRQLNIAFLKVRYWIHRLAIFDQFGWLAEEGFMPQMKNILVNKLKLKIDSPEYHRVLFALTTPENVSTTLQEKTAVFEKAIKIKRQKQTLEKAGKILAKNFGWLPIFCYGEPWQGSHYIEELKGLDKKDVPTLTSEYHKIKNHASFRNRAIAEIIKKYKIDKKDLQIFVDFGLAIDTRNEAEYFVSFGGYFLMPLYKEIAKRLFISVRQLRDFTEKRYPALCLAK